MELQELEDQIKHHKKLFAMLVVLALVGGSFLFTNFKINQSIKLEEEYNSRLASSLDSVPVLAKAVSVYDITESKKIYGKDDDNPLPIASLAKILTVSQGLRGHKLDDPVYVSPEAVKQEGDFGIFAYEKWKIGDLAKFTLVVSANDGAYALAETQSDVLNEINNTAIRMGLVHTFFMNTTGLDIIPPQINCHDDLCNPSPGAVATASEVNMMAIFAMKEYPEVFSATTSPILKMKSLSGFEHIFKNTDVLVGKIPNLIFSKTGYTELAGGNLCIIFKDQRGHSFVVTVLGSTFEGRFADMEKIVNVLYSIK